MEDCTFYIICTNVLQYIVNKLPILLIILIHSRTIYYINVFKVILFVLLNIYLYLLQKRNVLQTTVNKSSS